MYTRVAGINNRQVASLHWFHRNPVTWNKSQGCNLSVIPTTLVCTLFCPASLLTYTIFYTCAYICWQPLPTYNWPVGVHEQKAHGRVFVGVANETHYLWHLWAVPNESKHTKANFSLISTDLLCLWVTHMSGSRDLAPIQDTGQQIDKLITLPLAHARRVIMI